MGLTSYKTLSSVCCIDCISISSSPINGPLCRLELCSTSRISPFIYFYISSLISVGRDKEQEDHELPPSFDPRLIFLFSLVLSMSVAGRQVLDETEKMSSVERRIRSQQQGLN